MAAIATASSWLTRSRNRALIWGLQRLQMLLKAAWFQRFAQRALIRPMVHVGLWLFVWAVFADKLPESTPQVAQLAKQLREQLNARLAHSEGNERDLAFVRTMTWGTAGAGVVILAAIITAHVPTPALTVATAAFAVSVPFLVVLGFLYALQSDPSSTPPTARSALFQVILLYAAHLLFYFGLAALFWSYDPRLAALFVIVCYLALQCFRRFNPMVSAPPAGSDDHQRGPPASDGGECDYSRRRTAEATEAEAQEQRRTEGAQSDAEGQRPSQQQVASTARRSE